MLVGSIYFWGQGVAVDYPRAMAAYKVGTKEGDTTCQYQVGIMYYEGFGVDVDYKQARAWFEKAAAQDHPSAVLLLGEMYFNGEGVIPSWRCAREYLERAIELGISNMAENMQTVTESIQNVTSQRSVHTAPSSLVHDLMLLSLLPHTSTRTRSAPPSWASGWRSTARAERI